MEDQNEKVYFLLEKNLRKITKLPIGQTILNMKYLTMEVYEGGEDCFDTYASGVYPDCLDLIENKFKCICGRPHLKFLHYFKIKGLAEKLIIGSVCIETILKNKEKLRREEQERIEEIAEIANNNIRRITHKNCERCKLLKINKTYDYKNEIHKTFCKDCVVKKNNNFFLKCIDCNKLIDLELDWRDNYKTRCKKCWYLWRYD